MPYTVPQIPLASASHYAWSAYAAGSDAAPLHGDCSAPIDRELRGVGSILTTRMAQDDWDYADGYGMVPDFRGWNQPGTRLVIVRVRCRKCPECLSQKRRQWTARAIQEVRQSKRTWFGTLTVNSFERFRAEAKAAKFTEQRRAERLSSLTPAERTKAIAGQLGPEVTRWLKRVRKESGARLRYLLVVEAHKDGFPHFHLLLHELGQPVRKRLLERQWKLGFSKFKLMDPGDVRATGYVCKYLTKSVQTRVRASRAYGTANKAEITERLLEATRSLPKDNGTDKPACQNTRSEAKTEGTGVVLTSGKARF